MCFKKLEKNKNMELSCQVKGTRKTMSCLGCCLRDLPVVRSPSALPEGEFSKAFHVILDDMQELTDLDRKLIKARVTPLIDATERVAERATWWDTRLFMLGFCGSLIVTIAAAINQAAYITGAWNSALGTLVLVMSSIGTAALGARERLKFREKADAAKQFSCNMQAEFMQFLARAGMYTETQTHSWDAACSVFISRIETLKNTADQQQLALQHIEKSKEVSNAAALSAPPRYAPAMYAAARAPQRTANALPSLDAL